MEILFLNKESAKSLKKLSKKAEMENVEFLPLVGFTSAKGNVHLNKKNKIYRSFKNPNLAYKFSKLMAALTCYYPSQQKTGEGIFHAVILKNEGEDIDKELSITSFK